MNPLDSPDVRGALTALAASQRPRTIIIGISAADVAGYCEEAGVLPVAFVTPRRPGGARGVLADRILSTLAALEHPRFQQLYDAVAPSTYTSPAETPAVTASDAMPTSCLRCGAEAVLTTAETLRWMDAHGPRKCQPAATS